MRSRGVLLSGLLLVLAACGGTVAPEARPAPSPAAPVTSEAAASTPPVRYVRVTVATLWREPRIAREVDKPSLTTPAYPRRWVESMTDAQKRWLYGRIDTQALYGTKVYVLATDGMWTKVAVPSQATPKNGWGYPGWLPTSQLTRTAPTWTSSYAVVTRRTAWLWSTAASIGDAGAKVAELSYDTRLPVTKVTATAVEVLTLDGRHRGMRRSDVVVHQRSTAWTPTGAKAVTEARRFLGLEYLWAGTSGFGVDCSGLTYLAYHRIGVTLYRDASQQAKHGTAVAKSALRQGDLVFFKNSSGAVVHVAMYVGTVDGVRSVIEAPGTGLKVRIRALSAWSASSYAGARRYVTG